LEREGKKKGEEDFLMAVTSGYFSSALLGLWFTPHISKEKKKKGRKRTPPLGRFTALEFLPAIASKGSECGERGKKNNSN